MLRRLFHLASTLSLLAAVVLAVLEIISLHAPVAAWHIKTGLEGGNSASTRFLLIVNNKLMSGPYQRVRWLGISRHKIVLGDHAQPVSPPMPTWDVLLRRSSSFSRADLRMVWDVAYARAMQKSDGTVYEGSTFRAERGFYAGRTPMSLARLGLATSPKPTSTVQFIGASYRNSCDGGEHLFRMELPLWLLLPALLIAPAARLGIWWRRRRRLGTGRCPVCSYDLTLNVSGVCPECGSPTNRESAKREA